MQNEMYVFLSALMTGIATGFIYDLLRMKRRALKTRTFLVSVEDILFWIIAALLVFVTAYISNQGEIRPYFFLAMILGISIYFWLFSHLITQIITLIVKIIIWPFAKLIVLLRPPARWVMSLVGKVANKSRKRAQNYQLITRRRFRSIRNIMRKI